MNCGYNSAGAPGPVSTAHLSKLTDLFIAAEQTQEIVIPDPEAEGIRLFKPPELSK